MKSIHNNTPIFFVKQFLKTNKPRRPILLKALILISEAIESTCCTVPGSVVDLITPLEGNFINLITSIINSSKGKINKQELREIYDVLQSNLGLVCCSENASIVLDTNHKPVLNQTTSGYASIESGGEFTNFEYTVSGFCGPYNIEVAFNFGSGFVVAETLVGLFAPTYNSIHNVIPYLIGKQVNIGTGVKTVVNNATIPSGSQIQENALNGRTFTVRITVTDCNGQQTSSAQNGEIEMKRVYQIISYLKQLHNTGCDCAQNVPQLFSVRAGGGNFNDVGPYFAVNITTSNINTINIFNSYPNTIVHDYKTAINNVAGFNSAISFRNPAMVVIDAVATVGAGTDVGCIYTFPAVHLDVRDSETRTFVMTFYRSTVGCTDANYINPSSFNTNAMQYLTLANGSIISGVFSDSYSVSNITTPAALGW